MLVPMTLARRLATAFLVVATTAGAAFAVLVAGGSGTLEVIVFRLVYDVVAVVAIVSWLSLATFRRATLPSSRLLPAIVACLVVFTIATVTSRNPRLSAEMLAYAFLLAGLYLLLVTLMRDARLRTHLERLALVLCLVVCVLYLRQVLEAWQTWWEAVGHLTLPPLRPAYLGLSLGSPNPIATLVLLLGAFALAVARLRGRGARAVAAVLVALVAVTTVITGSRGAWIGAGAALVATGLVALVTAPSGRTKVVAFVRTRLGSAAVVAGLATVSTAGWLAASSGRLTLEDGGYRQAFASASLRMFESSPLVGVGPGVWQQLRASFQDAAQPDLYIPHAHNIYLQTLAEFGLAGGLAGLVVVLSLAVLVLRAIRSGDETRRRVGLATLFAIVLLAGQQLVDMLMNVPALLLALAIPLAWLDAAAARPALAPAPATEAASARSGQRRGARGGAWDRALVLGLAALTLVVGAGLLQIEAIAWGEEQGVADADAGRWADAVGPTRDAAASNSSVPSYWFAAGVAATNAGDLTAAADAFARSAAADDYPFAWLNLAAVRWRLGDTAGAREALARAERLGMQRVPVAVAAGWLRWQLGDQAAAISHYGRAVAAAPTLASDPFWTSDPELSAARPAILDAARQALGGATGFTPASFTLDLLAGDEARATASLAPLPAAGRAFYDMAFAAWQGLPGAEAALQQLAERHPLDPLPVVWCQLVAIRHGEALLITRYGAWLSGLSAGGTSVARIVLGQPLLMPGGGVDRYGSLYRRPVPGAQVIGILPQIAYQDHL